MTEGKKPHMTLSGLETAEQVYGIFGVCRSATTAAEKLLTLDGMIAYHQPLKSGLLQGLGQVELTKHQQPGPQRAIIKETIGAYSVATATFNPLQIIRGNVADERLQTIFTVKEPFNNFLSWIDMVHIAPPRSGTQFTTNELLDLYVTSSQTLFTMFTESRDAGIRTTVFDYESLKNTSPDLVTKNLLARVGIDPAVYNSDAWTSTGSVRSETSGIVTLTPPRGDALHAELDASTGFQYYPPNLRLLPSDQHTAVQHTLTKAGLYNAYEQMTAYAS